MLRKATNSDVKRLAEIHSTELSKDFLPSLGKKFLELLYSNLIQSKDVYVWVVVKNNSIQGFIVGSKDFNSLFKKIIFRNFTKFAFLILPKLVKKIFMIKDIFDTFFYTKKMGDRISAELVVIAVSKKFHRKGLGRKLVFALEKEFVKNHINKYKVSVNDNNKVANSFYISFGFRKSHDIVLYNKKINSYVKNL